MESKEFNEFVRDIKSKNKDITINFDEDLNKMISGMENTELQLALESFKDVLYEIRMTNKKSIFVGVRLRFRERIDLNMSPIEETFEVNVYGDVEKSIHLYKKDKITAGKLFKNIVLDILDWFNSSGIYRPYLW